MSSIAVAPQTCGKQTGVPPGHVVLQDKEGRLTTRRGFDMRAVTAMPSDDCTSAAASDEQDGAEKASVPASCVVCGRNDRAGEMRKSGYKCRGCFGVRSPKGTRRK